MCSKAITEAVRKNKRNWAYVEGVLKNWWNDGYKNGSTKKKESYIGKIQLSDGSIQEVSA